MTYLKMAVSAPRALPRYLATAAPVSFADGFYAEEPEGSTPSGGWGSRGGLLRPVARRAVPRAAGALGVPGPVPGAASWRPARRRDPVRSSPAGRGCRWRSGRRRRGGLEVEQALPAPPTIPADRRRARRPCTRRRLHGDPERHAPSRASTPTSRQPPRDARRPSELASTPPSLGIDLHGACNVKPPCVYCEWDFSKAAEGDHVDRAVHASRRSTSSARSSTTPGASSTARSASRS